MRTRASRAPAGVMLLEMVISLIIFALLAGTVFKIASGSVQLGNAVVRQQNEISEEIAFLELFGDSMAALPGNARFEMFSQDTGAQYVTDITIQDVPIGFNWSGTERIANTIRLSTQRRRDGHLDVVMSYFEGRILDEESGDSSDLTDDEPFAEVTLLEDFWIFEWRALDSRTMEWVYDWDLAGRLPLQLELVYKKTQYDDPVRHVFWIVPKQNPETVLRQMQTVGQAGGNPGQGNDGDDGDGEGDDAANPPTTVQPGQGGGRPGRPGRPGSGGRPGGGNRGGAPQGGGP